MKELEVNNFRNVEIDCSSLAPKKVNPTPVNVSTDTNNDSINYETFSFATRKLPP